MVGLLDGWIAGWLDCWATADIHQSTNPPILCLACVHLWLEHFRLREDIRLTLSDSRNDSPYLIITTNHAQP